MTYLGFFVVYDTPFWLWKKKGPLSVPPVQVVGPIMFAVGAFLVLSGLCCSICSSQVKDSGAGCETWLVVSSS